MTSATNWPQFMSSTSEQYSRVL